MDEAEASAPGAQSLPDPPWWSPEQRRSGRSGLSREAVVSAALRVLDRDGLDGLSMRRVADELGTGPASLYWHVANKERLLAMVLDRVIGEIPLPEPDPEQWDEQLREFARDGRTAFLRYRDIARASLGRIPIGPNTLRAVNWQLGLFAAAGIPAQVAAWFGDLFGLYVAAHAFEDTVDGSTPPEEMAAEMEAYMRSLPPEELPHLMANAGDLMAGDAEERFEFGLDLLIAGLAAMAQPADDDGDTAGRGAG